MVAISKSKIEIGKAVNNRRCFRLTKHTATAMTSSLAVEVLAVTCCYCFRCVCMYVCMHASILYRRTERSSFQATPFPAIPWSIPRVTRLGRRESSRIAEISSLPLTRRWRPPRTTRLDVIAKQVYGPDRRP